MGALTQDDLQLWFDLIHDMSYKWTELMEDAWRDLPPDTVKKLIKASRAFADAGENIMEHLGMDTDEDEE